VADLAVRKLVVACRWKSGPGSRQGANSALWRIVLVRMSHDPRTKAYVARRTAQGKTTKEIIRCLKRYVAREIYKALAHQARTPCRGRTYLANRQG